MFSFRAIATGVLSYINQMFACILYKNSDSEDCNLLKFNYIHIRVRK